MILKKYLVPSVDVMLLKTNNILNISFGNEPQQGDLSSSTCCPFNGLWCVKKQNRLDEWKNTVQTYSKERRNYTFYTRDGMFDGCPYDYTSLCKKHKQRQRD